MGRYMVMEAYTDALASQSVGFVYSHCSGKACGPGANASDIRIFAFDVRPAGRSTLFCLNRRCSLSFCFCWRAFPFHASEMSLSTS